MECKELVSPLSGLRDSLTVVYMRLRNDKYADNAIYPPIRQHHLNLHYS